MVLPPARGAQTPTASQANVRYYEREARGSFEWVTGLSVPIVGGSQKKTDSIRFGVDVRRKIFRRTNAKTIIAFGKGIARCMTDILKATLLTEHRAEWGNQTIDVYQLGLTVG